MVLCERGIKTFETETRNTMDLAAVALAKELSHLPVIADPSHGTGKQNLIPAVARAAVAVGADGLIVEVHPCPERALSDGPQSLDFKGFENVMRGLINPLRSCQTPSGSATCDGLAPHSIASIEARIASVSQRNSYCAHFRFPLAVTSLRQRAEVYAGRLRNR